MTDLGIDTVLLEEETPVSEQLVRAVAAREGVEPLELEGALYDAVDPDALDRLSRPPKSGAEVDIEIEFRYYGYGVTVTVGDERELRLEAEPGRLTAETPADFLEEDDTETEAAVHFCLDCGWRVSARDGHSTAARSRRAIVHHVRTGHTVDSRQSDR